MAVSNVSIANDALTLLSSSRIQSLTEDSENARKINAIFEPTRDELMSMFNWNFAKTQAELAQVDETPTIDWDNSFQIPSDCLRILRMEDDAEFQRYGDKVYTNETSAKIEYIARITDPTKFSPSFARLFAARLARDLAYGITQSSTVAQMMDANYTKLEKNASNIDGQEGSAPRAIRSAFITARQA